METKKWFFSTLLVASLTIAAIAHCADTASGDAANPVDPVILAANQAKAAAEAQKAAYDAQAAKSKAELDALKAKIGEVPASGYTGAVDLKANAGQLESSLLTSAAIVTASSEIVKSLPCNPTKSVLLSGPSDIPTSQSLLVLNAQLKLLDLAKNRAIQASEKAKEWPFATLEPKYAIPIAGIGLAVDAASKLLGYFKTEFTVGGVQTTFDDSVVAYALAGKLTASGKFRDVFITNQVNPASLSENMSFILTNFDNDRDFAKNSHLDEVNAVKKYTELVSGAEKTKTEIEGALKKATTPKEKAKLEQDLKAAETKLSYAKDGLKAHTLAEVQWQTAVNSYDAFFAKMFTPNDKGEVLLTQVLKEEALSSKIKDGYILVTKLQVHGGSYYTKKNIWTTFGEMPFYNSGGAVINYLLLDGTSRAVISSGVVPFMGGFVKPSGIADVLKAAKSAPEEFKCSP